MTSTHPSDDDVVHFLESVSVLTSLSTFGLGRVFGYGDELTLTSEIRQANKDRNGRSMFDFVDQGADEYVRGGRVLCRRGPWPANKSRLLPGSYAWEEMRRQAIARALATEDPAERRAARKLVDEEYGPSLPTSRTLAQIAPGPSR
jgi:hypothetical protein